MDPSFADPWLDATNKYMDKTPLGGNVGMPTPLTHFGEGAYGGFDDEQQAYLAKILLNLLQSGQTYDKGGMAKIQADNKKRREEAAKEKLAKKKAGGKLENTSGVGFNLEEYENLLK